MSSVTIAQGFYALLTGDATLTAMLSTFAGGPAVFTFDDPPEKAVLPYVQALDETSSTRSMDLDGKLQAFDRTVACFTKGDGNPVPVRQIADRVAALFRFPDTALAISGFRIVNTIINGPIRIDTDADTYGRAVEVTVWMYPTS